MHQLRHNKTYHRHSSCQVPTATYSSKIVPSSGSWKQQKFIRPKRVVLVEVVETAVTVRVTVTFLIAVTVLIVVEISSSLILSYEIRFMGLGQEITNNFVSIQS